MRKLITLIFSVFIVACASSPLMNEAGMERRQNIKNADLAYSYLKSPQTIHFGAMMWSKEDKEIILQSNVAACIHNTRVYNLEAEKVYAETGKRTQRFSEDECYPDDSKREYFKIKK